MPPPPEQLKAEKARLASEPILAVVGALRARLEGLWAFKVRAVCYVIMLLLCCAAPWLGGWC